jgi:phosphatidate cytidylyltransferase
MLKTRVITAIVALAALGVVLFVIPPQATQVVIGLLILAGAWEWSGFLGLESSLSRAIYVILIALLCATPIMAPGSATMWLQVALIWWFAAFIWTMFFPTPIPPAVRWVSGALVLVPLYTALVMLFSDYGPGYLLFGLLIVWAADGGAYFAGKRFGRVKLAPSISPGKTWEGVIGGLLLVVVLTILAGNWSDISIAVLVPFCLAVAAISIVGDLTVSMFKRTAGVKDSGSLFPGHGGVLDRVDSVAAAAPLFALGIGWLGLA